MRRLPREKLHKIGRSAADPPLLPFSLLSLLLPLSPSSLSLSHSLSPLALHIHTFTSHGHSYISTHHNIGSRITFSLCHMLVMHLDGLMWQEIIAGALSQPVIRTHFDHKGSHKGRRSGVNRRSIQSDRPCLDPNLARMWDRSSLVTTS